MTGIFTIINTINNCYHKTENIVQSYTPFLWLINSFTINKFISTITSNIYFSKHDRITYYILQTPPIFVPFRRRLSRFSGSRYFTHDLPLPTDECDGEDVVLRRRRAASTTSLPPLRRAVTRTSSLQTPASHYVYPVKRQASSPTINNVPRWGQCKVQWLKFGTFWKIYQRWNLLLK